MGSKKEKHKKRMKTTTEQERDYIYRRWQKRGRTGDERGLGWVIHITYTTTQNTPVHSS